MNSPDKAATVAHYEALALAAQKAARFAPPPSHPDHTRIEFVSAYLEGERVTADVEIDTEPMHYQSCTIRGAVEVCALYVRGFNVGMYFDASTLSSLDREAEEAVWRGVAA